MNRFSPGTESIRSGTPETAGRFVYDVDASRAHRWRIGVQSAGKRSRGPGLGSPELRGRLGAEGRRRYEERFILPRLVVETTQVYAEVLTGNPRE